MKFNTILTVAALAASTVAEHGNVTNNYLTYKFNGDIL